MYLGTVKNYGDLIHARSFLGLCELGLLDGMVFCLSMFRHRHGLLFVPKTVPYTDGWSLRWTDCSGISSIRFHGHDQLAMALLRERGY